MHFPLFADLNGDGKHELLVGRDQNTFIYFVNSSSKKNPQWVRQSITFANFETKSYWKNPTFADIDGDGDLDLIYGSADGELYFYRNVGNPKKPNFKLEPQLLNQSELLVVLLLFRLPISIKMVILIY